MRVSNLGFFIDVDYLVTHDGRTIYAQDLGLGKDSFRIWVTLI